MRQRSAVYTIESRGGRSPPVATAVCHHSQFLEVAIGNVMTAPVRNSIKLQAMAELHLVLEEKPRKLLPPSPVPLGVLLLLPSPVPLVVAAACVRVCDPGLGEL